VKPAAATTDKATEAKDIPLEESLQTFAIKTAVYALFAFLRSHWEVCFTFCSTFWLICVSEW
jgi:hypothetical protein